MILIYSSSNSPRLYYIVDLIFSQLLNVAFRITPDKTEFYAYTGVRLNYSQSRIKDELFIHAYELLFETSIVPQKITVGNHKGIKTLFANDRSGEAADRQPDLPFDIFSAAFYLVSRYEEYLPFEPDEHDRFPAEISIAFKEGFLHQPVVNYYVIFLKELIQSRYPDFIFPEKKYQSLLTYDIDQAFEFRNKGVLRNAGGYVKSLLHGNFNQVTKRNQVLSGNQNDSFDTFNYQHQVAVQFSLKPIYFFLLGDYNHYDINLHWKNKNFQNIIKSLAEKYEVGIHLSYESNKDDLRITEEIQRLEKISGKKVFRNRQHFLKLKFPGTYRQLVIHGITEDYTMGYPSQIGFRASVCSPFYFFDLEKNAVTNLLLYPFAVMDASLYYYLKLSSTIALEQTRRLIDEVRSVDGLFIFLAHNDLISETGIWKGWHQRFTEVISYMQ